jgi:3-hydroxy-3-methylglutaryl CoA synthase
MTGTIGIERIHCYPTTLALDLGTLCAAQGYDAAFVRNELMVDERGLNPPWEDTVTLAVNAAVPIVSDADRDAIGLLIVGTESGVDSEKSISTWVHRHLGLGPRCRNFEIKHACYAATGGLRMALAWLATAEADGCKALVISADQSLIALGHAYETVMGAAGVAVLVSRQPRLAAYEPGATGIHAFEVTDVFRPTPRLETGDGELSMVSYLEALHGAFADYRERVPASADFDAHFDWNIYHMPFPGMALRAHRALLGDFAGVSRAEALRHFERKCRPSVAYARRTGGTYGAGTFIGLLSLVDTAPGIAAGQRVGIFAYGAGSCAELYAARLLPDMAEAAAEAALARGLDGRRRLSFPEYAAVERERDRGIMAGDFRPDLGLLGEWYGARYEGRGLLVLDRIEGYYRHYRWS